MPGLPFRPAIDITDKLETIYGRICLNGELVSNPLAAVTVVCEPGDLVFVVEAPIRGRALRRTTVRAQEQSLLSQWLIGALINNAGSSPVMPPDMTALRDIGLLVRPEEVPEPVEFACPLRRPRNTYLAEGECHIVRDNMEMFEVNKNIRRGTDTDPIASSICDTFNHLPRFSADNVLWVEDIPRRISFPYRIDEDERAALELLATEPTRIDRVDSSTLRALLDAGILYNRQSAEADRNEWIKRMEQSKEELTNRGYCIIRNMFPEFFRSSLQRFYRSLLAGGYLAFDDGQCLRYFRHNEAIACMVHHLTLPLIRRFVPEPIKMSYAYSAVYIERAELIKHTDREQCEYTLSLSVDVTPESEQDNPWPLYLITQDGLPVTVLLKPGDGVLFNGRKLPHYRGPLEEGRTSSSLFLHYVPEAFTGTLS
jgi:hypothetical protein